MIKQVLELSARSEFKCIGSDCPRDCCHGWDSISVDDEVLVKWKNEEDAEKKEYLLSSITEESAGQFRMSESADKVCLSLDENKLCSIQLKYGHDYLSKVCREFPKITFNNAYRVYESVSFSCPVIVDSILFNNEEELFSKTDVESENPSVPKHDRLYRQLDDIKITVLNNKDYAIGIKLFFISDLFINLIRLSQNNELNDSIIDDVTVNTSNYLSDLTKSVKKGKLKTNPVTSGSFWKNIYELCLTRNIDSRFLDTNKLKSLLDSGDDSLSGYSKIYACIKQYRKKSNKQIKHEYNSLLNNYLKVVLINKGFPLTPKYALDLVLVDCMVNICVLQLLIWIEYNKSGTLSDEFMKQCIVEVDRKFVLHDGVVKELERNQHMLQIEKYCNAFLDLF